MVSGRASPFFRDIYGYDHASNLTSITPNATAQAYSYTSTNAITAGTYDANGSPTSLGGKSYVWDGANRIIHFANAANNTGSSFTYDGLGRLVRVVDSKGGTVTADHSYFWCGPTRCLAHDNTESGSPVSTQYFDQGVIAGGTSYYYVLDELGSVNQLVTESGSVAVQYTYDPYGNQAISSGTAVSDIGYAGYFTHSVSGLDFTLYRAYDPIHARWLNRDPIGELGGFNLYAHVAGNPISSVDPLGLEGCLGCHFPGLAPPPPSAAPIPPNAAGAMSGEPPIVKFPNVPAANDGSAAKSCPDDECDKRLAELNALADVIVRMRTASAAVAQPNVTFLLMQQNFSNKLIEFNTLCPQRRVQSTLVYRKAFPVGT